MRSVQSVYHAFTAILLRSLFGFAPLTHGLPTAFLDQPKLGDERRKAKQGAQQNGGESRIDRTREAQKSKKEKKKLSFWAEFWFSCHSLRKSYETHI